MKIFRRVGLALSIALLCWLPLQAQAACAIVQSGVNSYANAGTTSTVTLTSVVSGNSIIAVSMLYGTPTAPTASVSDGTAFTQAVRNSIDKLDSASATAIHYRHNVASGTHNVVVTTTSGAGSRYGWIYVAEVSGLVNTTANQTTGANADSANPATGSTSATTVATTCIFAAMGTGQASADAGIDVPATTGYTNRMIKQDVNAEMGGSVDTKSVSSTGVQSAAWGTMDGAQAWSAVIAAFEEGAGASPATLSAATPSGTLGTSTVATLGATSDVTSGTFYGVVDPAGQISGITAAQVIAAQDNAGGAVTASCNGAVSTTTPSCAVSGLTAATLYSYAVAQNSAGGNSNVLTGTFTTAAGGGSVVINPISGGGGSAARPVTFNRTDAANDDEFLLRAFR